MKKVIKHMSISMNMKSIVAAAAWVTLAAITPTAAHAQATEMAEGEVRKIDRENRKITLKHGPIKSLDMPGMTMVFNVNDEKLLDKVQTGDRIRFAASGEGGKFTVTEIQSAK